MEKFLDISAYQGNVDFGKIKKQGIDFVILRAFASNCKIDKYFLRNVQKCIENDIAFDAYVYTKSDTYKKVYEECAYICRFLKNMKIDKGLTLWVDIEDEKLPISDIEEMRKLLKRWENCCFEYNIDMGVYCGKSDFENYLKKAGSGIIEKWWIARYPMNSGFEISDDAPMKYAPEGNDIIAWQYTSRGKIDGINGNVDFDILF